jgi:hypothetical protein
MKRLLFAVAFLLILPHPCRSEEGIRVVSWPSAATVAGAAAISIVSVSTKPVTLAVERSGRLKIVLFNEKETLYVKAGPGASTTDYTWRMAAATPLDITAYSGIVTAVLGVVGPTNVHVTDF